MLNSAHDNTKDYGGHSMVANLQRVLVRKPNQALGNAEPTRWHYTDTIHLPLAIEQHNEFVKIMQAQGVEVVYHEQPSEQHADAIFVHDPVLMTDKGAILLRMGKALRRGEEALIKQTLLELNVPVLGELSSPAQVEGGDLLWLDEKTLLAGRGFRTNETGITALRHLLAPLGVSVLAFDLPYFQGREACLHLQSFISLVDIKTALVYFPLMPVALVELLEEKGFSFIEVPEQEFHTMGANALTIKPKLVLSLANNPLTKKRLEDAGIEVLTYAGTELSLKTEGGPTCLTRPLKRQHG